MIKHKILIIDDDIDILMVLKANLELYEFDVAISASWTEGQIMLDTFKPDLLLLDIMLPDGDGLKICKFIRKHYPKLLTIMLTARDKISDKVAGLEGGADDYVVKPFETIELIARIRACLRRSKPVKDKVTVRDMTVDFAKRVVVVRQKEVILTPKEFDLLSLLILQRDRVVTREEIKKALWKESKIYSWSRVIDVHIQHLRHKIEDKSVGYEFIVTIPGAGYMFIEG
jgi:DNA-binding response OmpR family regulator